MLKLGAMGGFVTIAIWLIMIFAGVPVGWSLMAATLILFFNWKMECSLLCFSKINR